MRISLITEGESEIAALPKLYPQLKSRFNIQLLNPMKIDIAPDANLKKLARVIEIKIKIALGHKANKIIIILDREKQPERCSLLAKRVLDSISFESDKRFQIHVVYKNSQFENWLVADPAVFKNFPKRFDLSAANMKSIKSKGADGCDAMRILKGTVIDGQYEKVNDAKKISSRMNIANASKFSLSFNHFLHVIDDSSVSCKCDF